MTDDGTRTSEQLYRLESDMRHLIASFAEQKTAQDDRWHKIEPVLLERSGEVERFKQVAYDLNQLGQKHRDYVRATDARGDHHEQELRRIEQRQNKVFWLFIGASSVLQLIWIIAGNRIAAAVFGGG